MSQTDWEHAVKGLPIDLLAWMGDDPPSVWTGKITGITVDTQVGEAILDIVIDGETKTRQAAWGQVHPR